MTTGLNTFLNGGLWAAGTFTCATPPVVESRGGFGTVVRNGDGDYSVTLDREIDLAGADAEGVVLAVSQGATCAIVTYVVTSDSIIQFLKFDAAGAALQNGAIAFAVIRTK